jgi:hypothetical protein
MKRLMVLSAIALAACATPQSVRPNVSAEAVQAETLAQQRFVMDERLAETRRVARIHRNLSLANIEYCKIKTKSIGLAIQTRDQYGKAFRPAAEAVGLTDTPSIAFVLDDSPAAAAGLMAGDKFVSVNGKAISAKSRGAREIEKTLTAWKAAGPIPLTVDRGGQILSFNVTPRDLCGYPIAVVESDEANAYADGHSIVLNRRILTLVENDDELALVIGHELAHNALGHIDAREKNQAMGMLAGALVDIAVAAAGGGVGSDFMRLGGQIGAGAYSKEFEAEADYVGMYFIARAGYRLDNVENIWRRFALEYPSGINFGGDHPATPERYVAIAAARDEIRALQSAGLPLKPRMKGDGTIDAVAKTAPAAAPPQPTDPPPAEPAGEAASAPPVALKP